ncbi:hypothetical protein [Prosthecobacter sp.]|jgi:hypothetical protein
MSYHSILCALLAANPATGEQTAVWFISLLMLAALFILLPNR